MPKKINDSNEVAYLLNDSKVTKVYGNHNTVSFNPGEKRSELLLNSKPNSIIMLHNHPGQSVFSLNDLKLFIENKIIQTLKNITNYSVVKYISKTSFYNQSLVYKIMNGIKQSKNMRSDEVLVDNILKKLYNKNI